MLELFASPPRSRNKLRLVVEKLLALPATHLLVRWSDPEGSRTPNDTYQFRYPIYDPLIDQLTTALIQANDNHRVLKGGQNRL